MSLTEGTRKEWDEFANRVPFEEKIMGDERTKAMQRVQEAMRAHGMPALAESLPGRWSGYERAIQDAIIRNWLGTTAQGEK